MKSSCLDFILHNLYFFEVNKINIYGMLPSFKDGWVLLAKALLESKGAQNEEETPVKTELERKTGRVRTETALYVVPRSLKLMLEQQGATGGYGGRESYD